MKKADMRAIGPTVLMKHGWSDIRPKVGRGVLQGARLSARDPVGREVIFSVRPSTERYLSFSRLDDGRWRTLESVGYVLAVVPSEKGKDIDAYLFRASLLEEKFELAWKGLRKARRQLHSQMPIFIPLDADSDRNVGHEVSNLKELASWVEHVTRKQALEMNGADDFFERVRQEIADRVGVDVSRVDFEFKIRP